MRIFRVCSVVVSQFRSQRQFLSSYSKMDSPTVNLSYVEASEVVKIVKKENAKGKKELSVSSYHSVNQVIDFVILDVRDTDEYSSGHISSAKNIPSGKWQDDEVIREVIEEHKGKDVIIMHCKKSQVRGPTCARILKDN